jgi:hypothetical protein
MKNYLDNEFLTLELLKTIGNEDNAPLKIVREYYQSLFELTNEFKNHPIECGYTEQEWSEAYSTIRQTLSIIPSYDIKYPYHTGLLREILAKAPLSFPE